MGSKEESLSSEPSVQGEGSLFFDLANGPIQDDSSERADNSSSELLEQESNPDGLDSTPEDSSWDFRELPLSERIDIRDAWGGRRRISLLLKLSMISMCCLVVLMAGYIWVLLTIKGNSCRVGVPCLVDGAVLFM